MIVWPSKDPAAVADYAFDFSALLEAGETLTGKTVTPDANVTVDSSAIVAIGTASAGGVQVWLSGGAAGTVAKVVCTVTTSLARTYAATAIVEIGGEAVDLATAKAAQRIDVNDEDVLLAGFLRAAIRRVEARTGKNLTQQIELQRCDGFPECGRGIRLYKGPVSEIVSVKYDDADGVEQSLTEFRLVEGKDARLLPAYGSSWPATPHGPGTVRVTTVAGYDPADRDLAELVQAAILLFGHYNANREAVVAGNAAQAAELPLGVEYMLASYCAPGIA